jgi:low affinity Fe/Cu permease
MPANDPRDAAIDIERRRQWVDDRHDAEKRAAAQRAADPHWYRGLFGAARTVSPTAYASTDEWQARPRASRMLHQGRAATTHPGAGAVAAVLLSGWLILGVVYGFPHWWELVLYSVTSSITLLLVFALQHTQARQESATQRKLDEILRSLPQADNRLIAVEDAADAELAALSELNRDDRARAQSDAEDRAER